MKAAILLFITVFLLYGNEPVEELELFCVFEKELVPLDTSVAVEEVSIPDEPEQRFTEEDWKAEKRRQNSFAYQEELRKAHGLRAGGITLVSLGSTALAFTIPWMIQGGIMQHREESEESEIMGLAMVWVGVPVAAIASGVVTGGAFMIAGGNRRQREAEKRFALVPEVNPFEKQIGFTLNFTF